MSTTKAAHTPGERNGTKRWNVVGSVHAKRHMAELRDRKARLAATEAAKEWAVAAGCPDCPICGTTLLADAADEPQPEDGDDQ